MKKLIINSTLMNLGTAFTSLLSFISIGIFIYKIDLATYAYVAIVYSLFKTISSFDMPFFLTLLKKDSNIKVLNISNIIFLLASMLIITITLSIKTKLKHIVGLYIIGFLIFFMIRNTSYLIHKIRMKSGEKKILKITIIKNITEFIITLTLLLFFQLNIYSIFYGTLVATLTEYILYLIEFKKEEQNTKGKNDGKYITEDYIIIMSSRFLKNSGLFICTFLLSNELIAILSIYVSIIYKVYNFSFINWNYLLIEYSKIKELNHNIRLNYLNLYTKINYFFGILLMIGFLTSGRYILTIYLGNKFSDYYSILLILTIFIIIKITTEPTSAYIYFYKTKQIMLNRILLIPISICATIFLTLNHGIYGLPLSILLVEIIKSILDTRIYNNFKTYLTIFQESYLAQIIILILIIKYIYLKDNIIIDLICAFLSMVFLGIFNIKKIRQIIDIFITEKIHTK